MTLHLSSCTWQLRIVYSCRDDTATNPCHQELADKQSGLRGSCPPIDGVFLSPLFFFLKKIIVNCPILCFDHDEGQHEMPPVEQDKSCMSTLFGNMC